MGTELQNYVNLFDTLLKKHVTTVGYNTIDNLINFDHKLAKQCSGTSFKHLRDFMDRSLEQYDREYVRKMMLKHEEVFKQQVRELHHLYKVQRILMAELSTKKMKQLHSFANASASTSETSHSSNLSNRLNSIQTFNTRAYEEPSRIQVDFGLQQQAREQASNQAIANPELEECDLDLTLSIGFSSSKKKLNPSRTAGEELGNPSSTADREKVQDPPWLFQPLSVKRT